MIPPPLSLAEVGQVLGVHKTTLARRRQGKRIVFDDGNYLETIRCGRSLKVPDAELRRFLGEQREAS